jgi:hypothetical protein
MRAPGVYSPSDHTVSVGVISAESTRGGARPVARFLGERYRHFQTAEAETTYVLGEFPWQVHVGEKVTVADYVAPPRVLSAEITPTETVWSLGEYTPGARIWEAFGLPGRPPAPVGVYENQPPPFQGSVKEIWGVCGLLLLVLLVLSQLFLAFSRHEEVFRGRFAFAPRVGSEASFVTDIFELKGRTSTVEVSLGTDVDNNWAYFGLALINADTGDALDFGREVSYYYGRDSDGAWSEGSAHDRALIPSVPAGRYYLRVEPEMDPAARGVDYEIVVRRDVPAMSFFWIAALLLLVPPAFVSFRSLAFEQARWTESDYGPPIKAGSGNGDDD